MDKTAHDLNNALGAVMGFASLARACLRNLVAEMADSSPRVASELASIQSIVDKIAQSADEAHRLVAGTVDTVDLPSAVAADFEAELRIDTRVLVIDDSPSLSVMMTTILRQAGYEVESFTEPTEALQRFTEAPGAFDLVITDAIMPGMSGVELSARIRAVRPDLPVVICTGSHVSGLENDQLPAGIRAIIGKPYRPRELTALVRQVLAAA